MVVLYAEHVCRVTVGAYKCEFVVTFIVRKKGIFTVAKNDLKR